MDLEEIMNTEENMLYLLSLKNDPESLKASINQEPRKLETFRKDFKCSYFTHMICPLFITFNGERVGYIGFTDNHKEKYHIISLIIDPRFRGNGFGAHGIQLAIEYVRKNTSHYNRIVAYIKKWNIASIKSFTKAGFLKDSEDNELEKYVYYFGETIIFRRISSKTLKKSNQ